MHDCALEARMTVVSNLQFGISWDPLAYRVFQSVCVAAEVITDSCALPDARRGEGEGGGGHMFRAMPLLRPCIDQVHAVHVCLCGCRGDY